MQALLEPIATAVSQLEAKLSTMLKETAKYSSEYRRYVSLVPFTVAQLEARAGTLASLARALVATSADKFGLVPTTRLNAFAENIRAIDAAVDELIALASQLASFGGAQQFEPTNGSFIAVNGQQVQFSQALNRMASAIDAALDNYVIIAGVIRPRSIGTFTAAAQLMAENASQSTVLVETLEKQSEAHAAFISELKFAVDTSGNSSAEVTRILSEIEKLRATAEENEGKIRASLATIDETREAAGTLQTEVAAYETAFRGLQNSLDARIKQLAAGDENLLRITKGFNDQQEKVADIIAQANTMLGSATVAGLSTHYDDRYRKLDQQVSAAKLSFYGSLGFLVFSVLLVLNFVHWDGLYLPEAFSGIASDTPTGAIAVRALSAFGARALVILPALLLAGFASKRHASLFRLREEYSHKFTAAASVNGFKAQAPKYKEQIAGAVFQELLINPANTMDEQRPEHRNGFIDKLIGPAVEAAVKKMSDIPGGGQVT